MKSYHLNLIANNLFVSDMEMKKDYFLIQPIYKHTGMYV